MNPQFVYKLPFHEWDLIITNTSHHFYYNENTKQSYWQLGDLKALGIDVESFLAGINFDELALLFAKARGLKVEEVIEESEEEKKVEEFEKPNEVEIVVERNDVDEGIRNLDQESDLASGQVQVIRGYSSSEEEEKEEKEEKEEGLPNNLDIDQLAEAAIEQYEHSESDSDESNDLDLSIDEETTTDFISLLEQFKSQISPFETWDLIEERLISEFIKYPEFYTIESKIKREEIFKQWSKEHQPQEEEEEEEEETNLYPTPTIEYLAFLQEFKSQIKSGFYQPFYTQNYEKINSIKLSTQQKETIFRNFKLMLNDFGIEERKYKKSNPNSGNFKIMKLNEFLSKFNLNGKVNYNPNVSFFSNWIDLLNTNQIDREIAENQINFLVGDEKRFGCYKSAIE